MDLGRNSYFLANSRNSSLLSPACCSIERRVPFLIVWCLGTVILCFPSVKYMWLPFWCTILNPTLFRALMTFRHEREGSFSDSYLHHLSFSFKLVKLLRERFQISFNRFSYIDQSLLPIISLTNCSRKIQTLSRVSAFRLLSQYHRELSAFNFNHRITSLQHTTTHTQQTLNHFLPQKLLSLAYV